MGRGPNKIKEEKRKIIDENYDFNTKNKDKIIEYLEDGYVVDLHRCVDIDKWRNYLYMLYKEELLSNEVDMNDIIKRNSDRPCGNEAFLKVKVEKVDYKTFEKVMKTRVSEIDKLPLIGYIVLKGNRKCDKDREIDSRTYRVTSNLCLYNTNKPKTMLIARDGQSVLTMFDLNDSIKKEEIEFCYFIGEGNIVINDELFKEEVENTEIDKELMTENEDINEEVVVGEDIVETED